MSEHAEQLLKHLREVEGGQEVLDAMAAELSPDSHLLLDERSDWDPDWRRQARLREFLIIRRGAGKLPPDFWDLPRPEDPEASVRRALEEDREEEDPR
jgi:hypothetical protein